MHQILSPSQGNTESRNVSFPSWEGRENLAHISTRCCSSVLSSSSFAQQYRLPRRRGADWLYVLLSVLIITLPPSVLAGQEVSPVQVVWQWLCTLSCREGNRDSTAGVTHPGEIRVSAPWLSPPLRANWCHTM